MKTLIIVDDDDIIRKGLSGNIAWEASGFRLAGAARNGIEALAIVENALPDIIVTDIRMPHKDGLQLTEELIARYPHIKVILMTSYEEFEFAKKALKLKVFDYLLKPFDNEMLLDTVIRAANELEREQMIRKQVVEGMPLLRQQFFESMILGRISEQERAEESQFLGLHTNAAHYLVSIIKIDDYHLPELGNRFGKEMLKYCIKNISEEVTALLKHCFVFNHEADEVIILWAFDEERTELERKAFRVMEDIRQNIEKHLKVTVTVGIGTAGDNSASVHRSYVEAKAVLDFRHITGTNQVLIAQDIYLQPPAETISLSELEKALLVKVKLGMVRDALSMIENLEQEVVVKRFVSLQHLHLIGMEIALTLHRELWEWIQTPHMEERFGGFNRFCKNIQDARTSKDIFNIIKEFVSALIAEISVRRDSHQKQMLNKAYQYIEIHYSQETLSLQDVANHVNASPGYLSTIFKKVGHTLFSEYLLETRMKAALHLLSREDLKSYEIADKVGFSNPQYFSVCFKKYTGITPSEYKNVTR